ncbi:MAG: MerR family transcriptional regulator [Lachnospiraceae bacterium]|nr:MerR family transcriptional regulator [Lachnospiraceae bacterium]
MDRKGLFSIGEVSKLFHISVSSLRHYENVGLIHPEYTSPDTGYRYYGTEQFEVLNTIRYLRALDIPLAEIEDFLKNRDISNIEEKLVQQKKIVLEKQKELKRIEQKISHRLNSLSEAQNMPLDTVSLVQLPAKRIVWVDAPLKIKDSQDMEASIRKLDQSRTEAVVFLGKVGLGISAEHLQKAEYAKYDGIFLILDDEDIYDGETITVAETLCVRLCFRGSHAEAPEQYKKLLDYINKHQMQIVGFSREITLIDYGITNDPEKFVTEICIPVSEIVNTEKMIYY